MKRWKVWAAIALAVLVGIVVLQNTEAVETRLLFIHVTMPLAVLLFLCALIGFVVGLLLSRRLQQQSAAKKEAART